MSLQLLSLFEFRIDKENEALAPQKRYAKLKEKFISRFNLSIYLSIYL